MIMYFPTVTKTVIELDSIGKAWATEIFFIYLVLLLFLAIRYDFLNINKPANRLEWWMVTIPVMFAIFRVEMISFGRDLGLTTMFMSPSLLYVIFSTWFIAIYKGAIYFLFLLPFIPYCIVTIRRYKSLNKSWTWVFWAFAPLGLIVQAVELGFCKSIRK